MCPTTFLLVGFMCLTSEPPKTRNEEKPRLAENQRDWEIRPKEFRVEVDVILEPSGSTGVYRARVWTHDKEVVCLRIAGNNISIEGMPLLEPDKKLHRTDFVIIVTLRDDPVTKGKRQRVERLYAAKGGSEFLLGDAVAADVKFAEDCKVTAQEWFSNLGAEIPIGEIFGQKLEVVARKAQPKK